MHMLYSTLNPEITQPENGIFFRPPSHLLTEKQLLKRLLRPHGPRVAKVLYIFDEPRNRPWGVNAVSAEECDTFRKKLELFGIDPCDQPMLHQLNRAGQSVLCNLFDIRQAEKITLFTRESDAEKLLGYMLFDGAHPKNFLTDTAPFGEKKEIVTWRREFSQPSMQKHLTYQQFFGPVLAPQGKPEKDQEEDEITVKVKVGKDGTYFIAIDFDRHSGLIDPWHFKQLLLAVLDILEHYFPQLRWHVEVNALNGSTKFFGWEKRLMSIPRATNLSERIRAVLKAKLPNHDFTNIEIWPSSLSQIIAPLRKDKINLIGSGELPTIKRHYKDKETGEDVKVVAYSARAFLNWLYFDKSQVKAEDLSSALDKALSQPVPEKIITEKKVKAKQGKKGLGGTNPIVPYKGRFRQALVDFWSGNTLPPDDTLDKFVVPTLRVLFREGLDLDEAEEWVLDHLEQLPDKSFSDRLSDDEKRLARDVHNWAKKIWNTDGVGGQPRPEESQAKLDKTVEAWQRCGFVLHDPATWNNAPSMPIKKVVWTEKLKYAAEQLADVAGCTRRQAKNVMNTILSFIDAKSELALSMVGKLLEACGIAGKSQGKRNAVRRLLESFGMIVKTANYYHDSVNGYSHGDFFVLSADVLLVEEGEDEVAASSVVGDTHTLSIYLSLIDVDKVTESGDLLQEARRLKAEERFKRRMWEFMKRRQQSSAA